MDLFADILRAAEIETEIYFRASFGHGFSVAVPEDRGRIRFHVAGEGASWIGIAGGGRVRLDPGDLVLIPHGLSHVLACSEAGLSGDVPGLSRVLRTATRPEPELQPDWVDLGGEGSRSILLCGHFACANPLPHPLFEQLPPLIHRRAKDGAGFAWLDQLVAHLHQEARRQRPGFQAVAQRMAEIVLIEVLRELHEDTASGFGEALGDPQLRRLLEALHSDLGADWSLDEMARRAGLSRSGLTERFRGRLGQSPMQYLTDWRLQTAERALRNRQRSVGEIAGSVGYTSEAAFNRAFRKRYGEPPGRRRRRVAAADPGG